jgi:hypothetical protein
MPEKIYKVTLTDEERDKANGKGNHGVDQKAE